MRQTVKPTSTSTALDYDSTLIGALELSSKKWVLAVQLPGEARRSRHVLDADGARLIGFIDELKARSAAAKRKITRVILTHEAGRDGFWLARFLIRHGIEVHVMQPSSVPVDRRSRRAKTDAIDVELLLRTLLAFLRGEPRVCSMVPIPDAAAEEARRAHRERDGLVKERGRLVSKIGAILATLGITGFSPCRKDRRKQLEALRQIEGDPVPPLAQAQILRLIDRLELVLLQIKQLEAARDAVLDQEAAADTAEGMIQTLAQLRAIGPQFATLLTREAFVRKFKDRRALASYVGLCGAPFASGGLSRDQGIGKDGNARLRAGMIELAWLWLRWQPDSALSIWFCRRVGQAKGRARKIAIVALARKLLVALWRYAMDGVVPEGAKMKTA